MTPARALPPGPWALLFALLWACGPAAAPASQETTAAPERASFDLDDPAEAGEATPSGGRLPTAQEQRVIERLSHAAERVRGLSFEHPVLTEIHPRGAIVEHLTRQMEEETLESSRVVYVALGLLPPDLDVRALLERVLGEQVVGYYDHEQDRLVIRDDVMLRLKRGSQGGQVDEARVTIVHELVHALQDQRLALGDRIEEEGDSDPKSAYHAVVEGDATLAMIGYVAQQAGGRLEWITSDPARVAAITAGAQAAPIPDEQLRAAPAIVRVTLVSAYLDGLAFAATLHGQGGWRAVDAAHRTPPISTEQILHPERYLRGERPDEVMVPDLPELERAGLRLHEEDVLGELEMGIYFGQTERSGVDQAAADGWSGDRVRVYGNGAGEHPVVWFSAWDDLSEAAEAEVASRRVLAAVDPGRRPTHRVERQGRALLIVRDLAPPLHAPVRRAFRAFAQGLPPAPPCDRCGG